MNFRKIIKAMDSVNEKHQKINLKYSSQSKQFNIYRDCFLEDETQDLRIYGTLLLTKVELPKTPSRNIRSFIIKNHSIIVDPRNF